MADKKTIKTPKGPPHRFQPGNPGSGVPGPGRPPSTASITYWLKTYGAMTPSQVAEHCSVCSQQLRDIDPGGRASMIEIIAIRALQESINDPGSRAFVEVLERVDGKVVQPVADVSPLTTMTDDEVMAAAAAVVAAEKKIKGANK